MFRPAKISFSVRLSLLGGALLLTGCPQPIQQTENQSRETDGEHAAYAPQEPEEPGDPMDPPTVTLANWAEVEERIAVHSGKVVVVDLWSTSYEPCKREFPHLVELHRQHKADDVVCMAVSLDYYGDETEPPESFRPAVEKFLSTQEANFPNFICTDSSDDVYTKVNSFGVPIVLVYGPDGKLAKTFEDDGSYGDEGFTYKDHIAPLVVELNEESP